MAEAEAATPWAVRCRRCDAHLVTGDHTVFLEESERAVHFAIDQEHLVEEERNDGNEWVVRSRRCERVRFLKMKQSHATKVKRQPFVVMCWSCQWKVGSLFEMDGWRQPEYLLDSKECALVVFREKDEVLPSRKRWRDTLEELRSREVTPSTRSPIEREQHAPTTSNKQNDTVLPTVFPTPETIRATFQPHGLLSSLRDYQQELAISALLENTIVYLPTGSGKTLVAVKVIDEMMKLNPQKKAVFLVPTIPLVAQQAGCMRRESGLQVAELSGQQLGANVKQIRIRRVAEADALSVTPQFFLNMAKEGEIRLEDFCVVVFDEAHHAIGAHPYRDILAKVALLPFHCRPRIVALTASPFGEKASSDGSNVSLSKLTQSYDAVFNTPTIATKDFPLQNVMHLAEWRTVEESYFEQELRKNVEKHVLSFESLVTKLPGGAAVQLLNAFDSNDAILFMVRGRLQRLQQKLKRGTDADRHAYTDAIKILSHIRKMLMSFVRLSIYGPASMALDLRDYFDRQHADTSSSIKKSYITHLEATLLSILNQHETRTDVSSRVRIIADVINRAEFDRNSRAIVFVRRRRTAIELAKVMERIPVLKKLNPTHFVGHNSFEGMSWESEQKPTLQRFRSGRIRLLVATNVLEEGLDVPECSLVIQFDGLVGLTSLIQSRGRVRHENGKFVILCTEEGKDAVNRMVKNELMMSDLARDEASTMSSKATVRELMGAVDSTQSYKPKAVPDAQAGTVMSQAHKLLVLSGFCVQLGNLDKGEAAQQVAVLEMLREYAHVRIVDSRHGLVALEAHDGQEDVDCYEAICRSLDFKLPTGPHFWIEMVSQAKSASTNAVDVVPISSDMLANVNEANTSREMIMCYRMLRGVMRGKGEFSKTAEHDIGDQAIFCWDACSLMIMTFEGLEYTFDPLAIYDRVIWMESRDNEASYILYATFQHPPMVRTLDEESRRVCIDLHMQSLSFAFHLTGDPSAIRKFRSDLRDQGFHIRDTHFERKSINEASLGRPGERMTSLPMAIAFHNFLSNSCHFLGSELPASFYEILHGLHEELREVALHEFLPQINSDVVQEFRDFLQRSWPILHGLASMSKSPMIYKVVVTPSRVLFDRPQLAPPNRIYRHFGSENFMQVHFRDENKERLEFSDQGISQRVRSVLLHGIKVQHCGANGAQEETHFRFLGCSLSQLRNGTCIFTGLNPASVREWIGDIHTIKSPNKYLKRLGQAFSSTRETFRVDKSVLQNPADDIKRGEYVFNDGCGEITSEGARAIASELSLRTTPSAFQIRLAGAKGVLVVSDFRGDSEASDPSRSVRLRKSMVKFTSFHNMLELVAHSGPSSAYLTRQSILILSDLGISDATFMAIQDSYIRELSEMIASPASALKEIRAHLPPDQLWWSDVVYGRHEDHDSIDPFHREIVRSIYRYKLTNTVLRARIPIANGRTLMGVVDFTGTLEYGEVYVQYTEVGNGQDEADRLITLHDCDVLVHRSPCHHPGDLRVLRCRENVPESLRSLRDCIVFPSKGERPHPDECTGGDLDGDTFVVIWDDRLIPLRSNVMTPMMFEGIADPPQSISTVDTAALVDFYLYALAHDILGVASNAHLALSDKSENGSFDRDALVLANICSQEVDCCKNPVHMDIVRKLAPPEYPDFMQNKEKAMYKSRKVLGKMFRRCNAIYESTVIPGGSDDFLPDRDYLIPGYEEFVNIASIVYQEYKFTIQALLRMSGAESEAELATGMVIDPDSLYKAEYFRFGEQCRDVYYRARESFRDEFMKSYGDMDRDDQRKVAAAWYLCAYSDKGEDRMLSFPWILADLLSVNKASAMPVPFVAVWKPVQENVTKLTIARLQASILGEIESRQEVLLTNLFERLLAVTALKSDLRPHFDEDIEFVLFGSTALLTFEPQSDLDVMVSNVQASEDFETLAGIIESMYGAVELRDQIRVPIISFSKDEWSFELCRAKNGPMKTWLFRAYMSKYPFFWPCVYFLLQWGKCSGLIRRRCGGGHEVMSPIGFLWLFLRFCCEAKLVEEINPDDEVSLESSPVTIFDVDEEVSFWTSLLEKLVGCDAEVADVSAATVIMSFLFYYGDLKTQDDAYAFRDPFDDPNNTQLMPESIGVVRDKCFIAVHQLTVSGGDITSLLRFSHDQRSQITLSRAFSRRVLESRDFFANKILRESGVSDKTKLQFLRHPNALRPDLLVADIVGDGESVHRIEQKIQGIEKELGMPSAKRSSETFHREGCTLLLFEGALSQQERLGFQVYMGDRHIHHEPVQLHQAHLVSFMNGQSWLENSVATFCTRFVRQMVRLSHFERLNPTVAQAKAIARFGYHYLINLPWSFKEEAIGAATIEQLEREFERGRSARELYESVLKVRERFKSEEREQVRDAVNSGDNPQSGNSAPFRSKALELQKGSTEKDRGVSHSFVSMIPAKLAVWLENFALEAKRMKEVIKTSSYQASIIWDGLEFNARLTPDLQLEGLKTRPCRWFSATLKMRQELKDDKSGMDSTPDVRYYVSTTEDVPPSHSLVQLLQRACGKAKDGRGLLCFMETTEPPSDKLPKVRLSDELMNEGISITNVVNVRHVTATTYQCHISGLSIRVQRIREFGLPSDKHHEGFLRVSEKTEAELVMPPLSPQARLDTDFAKCFLMSAIELVEYLRHKASFVEEDNDES
ncbi:hypothetical protein Poli38472_008377 [Pythium oligandrum]|uniref:RNA-directed RNA polymerase n=1 Tax=Pythium oligandrum TaxID=41045 RepID=A0A8K1CNA2_PYTOL|nr:hypothetical protein Poli38472_008377 [Pythium oligandrum]|eukprot:TMW65735.1 hypothetical protein Poli38472_008377 [Pythium oligandrum]